MVRQVATLTTQLFIQTLHRMSSAVLLNLRRGTPYDSNKREVLYNQAKGCKPLC